MGLKKLPTKLPTLSINNKWKFKGFMLRGTGGSVGRAT